MKLINSLLIKFGIVAMFLFSNVAKADLKNYWSQFYPGQKCIKSQYLGLYITGAGTNNLYETHGDRSAGARNVVLKMHSHSFTGQGKVIDVMIKYIGQQSVPTNSGFPMKYDFVEECI